MNSHHLIDSGHNVNIELIIWSEKRRENCWKRRVYQNIKSQSERAKYLFLAQIRGGTPPPATKERVARRGTSSVRLTSLPNCDYFQSSIIWRQKKDPIIYIYNCTYIQHTLYTSVYYAMTSLHSGRDSRNSLKLFPDIETDGVTLFLDISKVCFLP